MNVEYIKEEIRQQVKMSELVERLTGAKLNKCKMLCPFHTEKTPSFIISDEKGVFYCQGCGTGGDIFEFVQLYNGVGFKDAVLFVDNEFSLGFADTKPSYKQYLQAKMRANKRIEERARKEKKQLEYDDIALDYRICTKALIPGVLEPFSEL